MVKQLIMTVLVSALCTSSVLLGAPPEKEKFILASKLSWSPGDAPRAEVKIPEESRTPGGPPAVFKSGKWKYTYRVPSRHHSDGILEYDGFFVKPDKTGQVIKTPFGSLRFFSLTEERHLSGWFNMPEEEKEKTEPSSGGDGEPAGRGSPSQGVSAPQK